MVCAAPGCERITDRKDPNKPPQRFKFPSIPAVRDAWISKVQQLRESWVMGPSATLCECHFTRNVVFSGMKGKGAYARIRKTKYLDKHAVPNVFYAPVRQKQKEALKYKLLDSQESIIPPCDLKVYMKTEDSGVSRKIKDFCLSCKLIPSRDLPLSFFEMPHDLALWNRWKEAMNLPEKYMPSKNDKILVCARHFTPDQLVTKTSERGLLKKFLIDKAVPSKFGFSRDTAPLEIEECWNKPDGVPVHGGGGGEVAFSTVSADPKAIVHDHDYNVGRDVTDQDPQVHVVSDPFDVGEVIHLRKMVQQLLRDNRDLTQSLRKLFNGDQIAFLSEEPSRIVWSQATTEKAEDILKHVGLHGYNYLRETQKMPLPSVNMIQLFAKRRANHFRRRDWQASQSPIRPGSLKLEQRETCEDLPLVAPIMPPDHVFDPTDPDSFEFLPQRRSRSRVPFAKDEQPPRKKQKKKMACKDKEKMTSVVHIEAPETELQLENEDLGRTDMLESETVIFVEGDNDIGGDLVRTGIPSESEVTAIEFVTAYRKNCTCLNESHLLWEACASDPSPAIQAPEDY